MEMLDRVKMILRRVARVSVKVMYRLTVEKLEKLEKAGSKTSDHGFVHVDEAQYRKGDTKEEYDTNMHGDGFDFGEPWKQEEDFEG